MPPPDDWKRVERILAIRQDNIGDVVMVGPALRALRSAFPKAHIALLASPAGSKAAPLLPWVDAVIPHRPIWQDAAGNMPFDPGRESELVRFIRGRHFDAAVIFTSFSQSPYPPAYACYIAGIPIRLGQSKEFGGSVLSHWVKTVPDSLHQVDRNLLLLESAGFDVADRELEVRIPEDDRAAGYRLLREAGVDPFGRFTVLAPWASCEARQYHRSRFAEAARLVAQRTESPVVVVGSERDMEAADLLLSEALDSRIVSIAGRDTIPRLAAILSRASLLIANNSAPMHIADAVRTPMVILYSGTEMHSQWRPRSAPAKLLTRRTSCSPCYSFRCPYGMECLDIAPEEVAAEAIGLWSRTENAVGGRRELLSAKGDA